MPGILKIGMTERSPEDRLSDANSTDTWRPPTPYKIELAKKVHLPKQKENAIHRVLEKYTERINPRREFFRLSVEQVKEFFELMDGENWTNDKKIIKIDDSRDESVIENNTEHENNADIKPLKT
jgi:hypothetical protein